MNVSSSGQPPTKCRAHWAIYAFFASCFGIVILAVTLAIAGHQKAAIVTAATSATCFIVSPWLIILFYMVRTSRYERYQSQVLHNKSIKVVASPTHRTSLQKTIAPPARPVELDPAATLRTHLSNESHSQHSFTTSFAFGLADCREIDPRNESSRSASFSYYLTQKQVIVPPSASQVLSSPSPTPSISSYASSESFAQQLEADGPTGENSTEQPPTPLPSPTRSPPPGRSVRTRRSPNRSPRAGFDRPLEWRHRTGQ